MMTVAATAEKVRARIVDERLRFPLWEAARAPGEPDRIVSLWPSIVIDGDEPGGDPRYNEVIAEIELPADADISTVQVWLPRTAERLGPFEGVLPCPVGDSPLRTLFPIGVSDLLDLAAHPSNASLGIKVISDNRPKPESAITALAPPS